MQEMILFNYLKILFDYIESIKDQLKI